MAKKRVRLAPVKRTATRTTSASFPSLCRAVGVPAPVSEFKFHLRQIGDPDAVSIRQHIQRIGQPLFLPLRSKASSRALMFALDGLYTRLWRLQAGETIRAL